MLCSMSETQQLLLGQLSTILKDATSFYENSKRSLPSSNSKANREQAVILKYLRGKRRELYQRLINSPPSTTDILTVESEYVAMMVALAILNLGE